MDKQKPEYSARQRRKAYFKKKAAIYNQQGYRLAKKLARGKADYSAHCYSYMIDLSLALCPALLWLLVFLAILCGFFPVFFLTPMYWITLVLLFFTSMIMTGLISVKTRGQSLGRCYHDLKVVRKDNREANSFILFLRELIGIGLPVAVLGYFFNIFGLMIFWLLNVLVVIASPDQRSIADWILGTHLVYEPQNRIRFEEDVRKDLEISPIDLHIHSNFSDDGYYDVEDLFAQAQKAGIRTISITDHNCARANTIARRMSVLYDIRYIPGIEIDCVYQERRVRVLGYYIDEKNELFNSVESESLKREKKASLERARKLKEYTGMVVDMEKLLENNRFQMVTGLEIAKVIFANEVYRQFPIVQKYLKEESEEKAVIRFAEDLFGKGGPCDVELRYPALEDILEIVHLADGIAVLSSWNCDNFGEAFISSLIARGFDGIEVFSPLVKKETMTKLLKVAKAEKLFVSAGSDFHGPSRPDRYLGVTNCPPQALSLVEILTQASEGSKAAVSAQSSM